MSSGNWMIGHVVFLKTQSTDTASQNAFHSAHLFQGGVGTVVGSRLPRTLIAPPIQMICSIFDASSGAFCSSVMIGVKGHVTSSVTGPDAFSIKDCSNASPSGNGGQSAFGPKFLRHVIADSRTQSL